MFHPTDQISPVNVDSTSIAQASPTGKRCCGRTNRPSLLGISINEVINLNHLCQAWQPCYQLVDEEARHEPKGRSS
jgi:hypothetical protein